MKYLSAKQKTIFIVLVILVIGVVLFLVFSKNNQTVTTEPEKGGIPTVVLEDEKNALYDSVTKTDYAAIKARLTDYVISQKGDPWTTVKISGVKTPVRVGTVVSFRATIDSLNQKDLLVEFDYAAKPYPTFMIKEKNYSVPLYGGQD